MNRLTPCRLNYFIFAPLLCWTNPVFAATIELANSATAPALGSRPNVLFIAIDDMNNWLGCMGGHPQVKTPNIDRLGEHGTVFRNAHCQSPLCNPSRTSLMLGLRPSTTGIYALEPWFRKVDSLKNVRTLPQYFADHGYRTLSTGKIYHDGQPAADERINGKEFTVWGPPGSHGPLPPRKFVNTPTTHPMVDWGIFPERDDQMGDWQVADWAIKQIQSMPREQTFFLSVGFRKPHVPCYAPRKWFDLYPLETLMLPPLLVGDRDDTPRFSWYLHWKLPEPRLSWLQANNQWRPLVQAYLACVSFVDSQVGRVLNALEAAKLTDQTIIVLWGDNGWHLGEKDITGKNSLWDPSTCVPLIFAGPGVSPNGRCGQPAELLDIYPTLVDLAGLPAKQGLEGHSLIPQLKDAAACRPWPAITTHGPGNHGIRTERWRYICYGDGSEELYDISVDPREWHNLANDPKFQDTKHNLTQWRPKTSAPPAPGSVSRLIELRDGIPMWEGRPISENAPIPSD